MRIISLNVGLPREVMWKGKLVTTGIFKEPVSGQIALRKNNLQGDAQADLTVHGGVQKAVYMYPSEHYGPWRRELPEMELPYGIFGENFTTEGLFESTTCIGDRLRIGTAVLRVTEPRMPCFKLGLRFGRDDILRLFLESGRSGIYCAVEEEGVVGTGNAFTRVSRDDHGVTIADFARVYAFDKDDTATLRRLVQLPLSPSWREHFEAQLSRLP